MKQQKEFSIQDWKSDHFYKLIEGMEMPLGADAGVTPEHEAILRAIQDMVQAGDSTILDLIKDKMQAEWGDAPQSGKQGPWSRNYNDTDDIENANLQEIASLQSMFPAVDQGEMDNDWFIDLFQSLAAYFKHNADDLTNMDAEGIARHCEEAAKAIRGRSGN